MIILYHTVLAYLSIAEVWSISLVEECCSDDRVCGTDSGSDGDDPVVDLTYAKTED